MGYISQIKQKKKESIATYREAWSAFKTHLLCQNILGCNILPYHIPEIPIFYLKLAVVYHLKHLYLSVKTILNFPVKQFKTTI